MHWRLSRYHVTSPVFVDGKDGLRKRIVMSRTGETCTVAEKTWTEIASNRFDLLSESDVSLLRETCLLVSTEENELGTLLSENDAAIDSNDQLVLVVQPTAACQLGCGYCSQKHTRAKLSTTNQDRLIGRTNAKLLDGRFRHLVIRWFGGEPLLGLDVIRRLSPKFIATANKHNCDYKASITTNAVGLNQQIADELLTSCEVRQYEITLDGTAEFHDKRRKFKGGGGTYKRIFDNIVSLATRDDIRPTINVRCNIDGTNIAGFTPLLEELAEAGIQERINSVYPALVYNWGNSAGDDNSLTIQEFSDRLLDWFATMLALGFRVAPIPRRKRITCLAVQPDSELVDPHGTLFNCTECSLIPAYESKPIDQENQLRLPIVDRTQEETLQGTNRYAIGSLRDGEIPDGRAKIGSFNDRIRRQEVPCYDCKMLPTCGGACPKQWLDERPPCPPEKYIMPQLLMLAYAADRLPKDK